jgi:hypothetical protein
LPKKPTKSIDRKFIYGLLAAAAAVTVALLALGR